MVRPKAAANNDWFFQKVFGDGEFIAAGQLIIPPKGRKPSKGTKDNTYVRSRILILHCWLSFVLKFELGDLGGRFLDLVVVRFTDSLLCFCVSNRCSMSSKAL